MDWQGSNRDLSGVGGVALPTSEYSSPQPQVCDPSPRGYQCSFNQVSRECVNAAHLPNECMATLEGDSTVVKECAAMEPLMERLPAGSRAAVFGTGKLPFITPKYLPGSHKVPCLAH